MAKIYTPSKDTAKISANIMMAKNNGDRSYWQAELTKLMKLNNEGPVIDNALHTISERKHTEK